MTNYNKQATDFLKATNTTLEVKEAVPQTAPTWDDSKDAHKHIKYAVTLKNKHHTYTFDFWGSVNDYNKANFESRNDIRGQLKIDIVAKAKKSFVMLTNEQIKRILLDMVKPSEYDILACLSPMYESTFDDWGSSYGYDVDSRKAYTIYMQCVEQDLNLRKLFDREELETLSNIN